MSARARALGLASLLYTGYRRHKPELRYLYRQLSSTPKSTMPYRSSYRRRYRRRYPRRRFYRRRRTYSRRYPKRRRMKYKLYRRTVRAPAKRSRAVSSDPIDATGPVSFRSLTANVPTELGKFANNFIDIYLGQLYYQVIPYPVPPTTTDSAVIRRESNSILANGLRICRKFKYHKGGTEAQYAGPIQVHWALVQAKDSVTYENRNSSSLGIMNRLFTQHSDVDDKTTNFVNVVNAADNWRSSRDCLKLNSEYGYKILTHKKFVLQKDTTGAIHAGEDYSVKVVDKYYKIGKRQNFNDNAADVPMSPIMEIFWCQSLHAYDWPADPTADTVISATRYHTLWYKEDV